MIRAFIALDLPPFVHESLGNLSVELQRAKAAVSWVKPGRIHLTLKFLGNIHPEKIEGISEKLAGAAFATRPFRLRPKGCGAFPTIKQMRVVWVGLEGDLSPLKELHRLVETAMASMGFEPEGRGFKPHLTLGRVKGRRDLHLLQEALLALQDFEAEAFDVTELVLYKSELRPEGAHYTPLFRAPFSPQ